MKYLSRRQILGLILSAPLFALATRAMSQEKKPEEKFIGGDGGPMIVLQESAIKKWQGASENGLMGGGTVEDDYDVICEVEAENIPSVITRHKREMLVLEDSEWGGFFFSPAKDLLAIVQPQGTEENVHELALRLEKIKPNRSFPFHVRDSKLRLMVGAESAKNAEEADSYGLTDLPVNPGHKRCDVYILESALVILIRSAK